MSSCCLLEREKVFGVQQFVKMFPKYIPHTVRSTLSFLARVRQLLTTGFQEIELLND